MGIYQIYPSVQLFFRLEQRCAERRCSSQHQNRFKVGVGDTGTLSIHQIPSNYRARTVDINTDTFFFTVE